MTLYGRRRANNALYLALSWTATGIGLAIVFLLRWTLLSTGIPALGTDLFVANTPPPGGRGGIANAIFGSLVMTGIATLVGTPVGVLTGTYLAEFGAASRIASAVRFINDVLLTAPSLIIGLFAYGLLVVPLPHSSARSGSVALP